MLQKEYTREASVECGEGFMDGAVGMTSTKRHVYTKNGILEVALFARGSASLNHGTKSPFVSLVSKSYPLQLPQVLHEAFSRLHF